MAVRKLAAIRQYLSCCRSAERRNWLGNYNLLISRYRVSGGGNGGSSTDSSRSWTGSDPGITVVTLDKTAAEAMKEHYRKRSEVVLALQTRLPVGKRQFFGASLQSQKSNIRIEPAETRFARSGGSFGVGV